MKLWENSTKGTQISAAGGSVQFPTSDLDKTIWVEATAPSASLRDIVLTLTYKNCKDTVKATAVWVTKTARAPWYKRQAPDGFPDNPVPGPGGDLPDLTDTDLLSLIADRRAADGSRYGQGTKTEVLGDDKQVGGRILYEFQIMPAGVEALGVVFDATRQIEWRGYVIFSGKSQLRSIGALDFPWNQTPVLDNELPNDDGQDFDEQNVPVNDVVDLHANPFFERHSLY